MRQKTIAVGAPIAADARPDGRAIQLDFNTDTGVVRIEFEEANLGTVIESMLRASRNAGTIRRAAGEPPAPKNKWLGAPLQLQTFSMGSRPTETGPIHVLVMDTGGTHVGFQMNTDQVAMLRDAAESKAPKRDTPSNSKH